MRHIAAVPIVGIIGTLFGAVLEFWAVLELNGAKTLGADEKKDKD